MSSTPPVFKIIPTTQQYDWGKIGRRSKVAQFASASRIPDFSLDESSPYAELWMGTHPTAPSRVLSSNKALSSHLASHPNLIGNPVVERFNAADGNLPFLFKVLAIEKALSIQTHPDKKTAEALHAKYPDIYKDPNHKPEMVLALTPFIALCGFRPLPEIAVFLHTTPEFSALIPSSISQQFLSLAGSSTPSGLTEKATLRDLFSAVMTADASIVKEQLVILVARYKAGGAKSEERDLVDLVRRVHADFPGDVGIFCAFLLNHVHLYPGEAMFLGAGEPHAYIAGDAVECMANSDNVIRAGLTPKYRDIPNLISGLTYMAAAPTKHAVEPVSFNSSRVSTLYDPPIPEFSVVQVKLPSGKVEPHAGVDGPSVAIVTDGAGRIEWDGGALEISVGDVFFIGAVTAITLTSDEGELVVYRAFVEAD